MKKTEKNQRQIKKKCMRTNSLDNIVLITLCGISLIIMGIVFVSNDSTSSNNMEKYLQVQVSRGDTLWNLAHKHNTNREDIRSIVYQIKKINDLETAEIYPGQTILIPTS